MSKSENRLASTVGAIQTVQRGGTLENTPFGISRLYNGSVFVDFLDNSLLYSVMCVSLSRIFAIAVALPSPLPSPPLALRFAAVGRRAGFTARGAAGARWLEFPRSGPLLSLALFPSFPANRGALPNAVPVPRAKTPRAGAPRAEARRGYAVAAQPVAACPSSTCPTRCAARFYAVCRTQPCATRQRRCPVARPARLATLLG
jgi:hypothetical protein